jgi:UDPglucose--hexose-1-phosphate uridylyltransferase
MNALFNDYPHRRWNPLTESWVLVSPHRANRPWQGQLEKNTEAILPTYDPTCYLCPGNTRANGEVTPDYTDVFVFDNDFAAILPDNPLEGFQEAQLFRAEPERGWCRVICFSPRHDLTVPEMEQGAIRKVVDLWRQAYLEMGQLPHINHVQIFENKGAIQGCSNPHPHGQIWAQEHVPDEPLAKQEAQEKYFAQHGHTLLFDYIAEEIKKGERILFDNGHFVGLVPFWAVWPFEAMIIPKRAMPSIAALTEAECDAFADAYRQLTVRYDNLFETSFPYSAGIHQAPTDGKAHPEWHWHMAFYPPLLRSATVKKFMVGYEMLAEPQRDITAERAAFILKTLPSNHYKEWFNNKSSPLLDS